MASPTSSTSSTPTSSPTKSRPRRASRFIEGTEYTGPEMLQQTPSSNTLLSTILSEMDAHETQQKHKHRESSSSVDSFNYSTTSSSPTTDFAMPKEREGRRSITFGRMSTDPGPREASSYGHGDSDMERIAKKFKGRLRAWTVGRIGV